MSPEAWVFESICISQTFQGRNVMSSFCSHENMRIRFYRCTEYFAVKHPLSALNYISRGRRSDEIVSHPRFSSNITLYFIRPPAHPLFHVGRTFVISYDYCFIS